MKQWPEFYENGDLPLGIHQGTLAEVLQHFGTGNVQRRLMGQRLERIHKLTTSTGQVARFVVFGSFVTAKPTPGDVDIILVMENSFDANQVQGRRLSFSIIWQYKRWKEPVCFGFDAWQQLMGSKKLWNIGN